MLTNALPTASAAEIALEAMFTNALAAAWKAGVACAAVLADALAAAWDALIADAAMLADAFATAWDALIAVATMLTDAFAATLLAEVGSASMFAFLDHAFGVLHGYKILGCPSYTLEKKCSTSGNGNANGSLIQLACQASTAQEGNLLPASLVINYSRHIFKVFRLIRN